MRAGRTAALALTLGLLLSGCAGSAGSELRTAVADLTTSANGRDAEAVRDAVDEVLAKLADAQRSGDVSPEGAAVIRERALAVQAAADEIDPDVIARREAEAKAEAEEQARIEAEREAAEAEQQRREAERLAEEEEAAQAEQERKQAEEAAKQAEEERKKAEEEAEKAEEKQKEEDEGDAAASPTPSPVLQ